MVLGIGRMTTRGRLLSVIIYRQSIAPSLVLLVVANDAELDVETLQHHVHGE